MEHVIPKEILDVIDTPEKQAIVKYISKLANGKVKMSDVIKTRASSKKYYDKHKESVSLANGSRIKERYASDPMFRQKMIDRASLAYYIKRDAKNKILEEEQKLNNEKLNNQKLKTIENPQ